MAIYFYKTNDEFGCFSNFSKHGFELYGIYWKTSEHFFQAQKFSDNEYKEKIRLSDSPMEAANLGRSRLIPIRKDWEEVKDDMMRIAVLTKFSSNTDIRLILLSTNNQELIEATKDDYYWGCGKNGNGKNMLGKILMEIREKLRNQ